MILSLVGDERERGCSDLLIGVFIKQVDQAVSSLQASCKNNEVVCPFNIAQV